MAVKISQTSKMKIKGKKTGSWSLEARKSCPGSKNPDGSVVEVCQSCYATKGMYRFPVVKAVRQNNQQDYHRDDWVDDMVKEVSKFDYFRWMDSGDVETPELALKIRKVVRLTSKVKHWLPTRSDKIPKIAYVFNHSDPNDVYGYDMYNTHNLALRPSADNIGLNNQERPGVNSYVIRPEEIFEAKKQGIHVCPVGINPNQKSCDTCTACYTTQAVAYVLH